MKRIVYITSWALFVIGTFVLVGFTNHNYNGIPCEAPEIIIDKSTGHDFVTEEMVLDKMNDLGYSFNQQTLGDIEVDRIEKILQELPGAKTVESYKSTNGVVHVELKQRRPIARVIAKNGVESFYLDAEGEIMPLSKHYVASVPVYTGELRENWNGFSMKDVLQSDSLQEQTVLDDVYQIAQALDEDEFMRAQIVQIVVNKRKEFEMIPRVGNHRILFGKGEDAELKMKKLNKFYTEAINPKELNLYDTINVKYYNQIICSKR